MSPSTRYIIQVDRPGERVDMATIRALLDGVGVAVDPDYGPVAINPKLGRYVVRGVASPDAREGPSRFPASASSRTLCRSPRPDTRASPPRLRLQPQRFDRRPRIDHPVAQVVVPALAPEVPGGSLQEALELRRRQSIGG